MSVIFSTNPLHPEVEAKLAEVGELRVATSVDAATLLEEAALADMVIVRAPLPRQLFSDAHRLRAAIRHGAGLDMIPLKEATAAGVLVANVPGANAQTVAEHVFMVALALLRQFPRMDRDLRNSGWLAARMLSYSGEELGGRRMGIVGMGNVGRAVARIAKAFGLEVITSTRTIATVPDGVLPVDLDELFTVADIVALCCPLTERTRGLVDRERLARMKSTSLLINVARGPIVDEKALLAALTKGQIAGAALDVFSNQPLPPDHPFFKFDNVILTPHVAGITQPSMLRMGMAAAQEARRVLSGELPENLCNPEAITRYRKRFPEHS